MEWSATSRRQLQRRLLRWFQSHARDLPWRQSRDAYRIWVSEVMLQQTQVVTVVPYFERFVSRFPDVAALAAADEQEVLRSWEGLGYYRRARQLHLAAQEIMAQHGGAFPTAVDDVLALPGIGRYTAAAILSIAGDARLPILEANTIRLFARLLLEQRPVRESATQKRLWEFSESLLPRRDVGRFNQALMELGSEICSPRGPRCSECPLAELCPTRELGWQERIPASPAKKVYQEVVEAALILHSAQHAGGVLVRRCGQSERWAGLWDFPRLAVPSDHDETVRYELATYIQATTRMRVAPLNYVTRLKHGVTRYRITLLCYRGEIRGRDGGSLPDDWRWVGRDELERLPLSSTGRSLCKLLSP